MKKLLLLSFIFSGITACQQNTSTHSPTHKPSIKEIKEYIIAMEDTLAMAYKNKDIKLFERFYAENAVTYGEGREQLFGKQQILNHFRRTVVDDTTRSFNFKYNTIDVFTSGADMAVESGKWVEYNDSAQEVAHGFYMVLFQKVDGRWKSTRDMWNSSL